MRGLEARGRAALRAEEQEEPFEPLDDTIERLGAAYDLLLRWLGLVVRLHPEVKEDVKDVATREVMLDLARMEKRGGDTASFRKLTEHIRRAVSQGKELAGE